VTSPSPPPPYPYNAPRDEGLKWTFRRKGSMDLARRDGSRAVSAIATNSITDRTFIFCI